MKKPSPLILPQTRREFIAGAAAAGIGASIGAPAVWAADKGPRIKSMIRREETTLRLGGDGDNFHMSWAADDRQLAAVCDGAGWSKAPSVVYNSRLWASSGSPQQATFQNVPGYPDKPVWDVVKGLTAAYYGFGTLALDGRIYQFLSTPDVAFTQPAARFIGAKLIYSPDKGRTWCNQDGSTPVVWESAKERSPRNMVFFEEPQDAFSLLSILQMGRGYRANRDGYVYGYAPNGSIDGTMNELVMFRVPKAQLLERRAYEYFAGLRADGNARWANDINARTSVHTFPRGWVNKTLHPWAWMPSITYNAPLGLYMMASWGNGSAADGSWFHKPSYLGFWVAPNPWGPWTQIHEDTAWTPGSDPHARAFAPQIAPKWIAADGKSFWLVWSDFQHTSELEPILNQAANATGQADFERIMSQKPQYMPYYAFNTQRVDLVIT